jgi:hypothetical protein
VAPTASTKRTAGSSNSSSTPRVVPAQQPAPASGMCD